MFRQSLLWERLLMTPVPISKAKGKKVSKLRDKLINEILKIPETRLNGDTEKRLPGNVNISIRGIEGESLLLTLDMNGIAASSGSACTSGSLDPSHVLLAMGLPQRNRTWIIKTYNK